MLAISTHLSVYRIFAQEALVFTYSNSVIFEQVNDLVNGAKS